MPALPPYLVHQLVERAASGAPERPFVTEAAGGGGTSTYGEVWESTCRLARLLGRLGLSRGDRVGLLAQSSRFYVDAYYAILAAGGVAVPLNTAADAAMLSSLLDDCGAKILISGPKMLRLVARAADQLHTVRHLVGPDPARIKNLPAHITPVDVADAAAESTTPPEIRIIDRDPASIIYTSGSTGRPRGAVLSHLALVTNSRSIVSYLELTPDDRVLAVLPFYYVYGKSLLNTHAHAGGQVVIEPRFQYPKVALDTLESERCTGFSGVPSSFAILLDRTDLADRELPDLRYVTQAGGAMSPALTRRLIEALPGKQIFIMYGATEASARLAYLPPDELEGAIGSIGRAIPNVELTVRRPDGSACDAGEVGELHARGSNIMDGYYRDADETARVLTTRGYATGDLARRDERGLLYIVGRIKQMIKAGGHRISPQEIEDAILEHPDVHEVAVIGRPDELLGEQIVAIVVVRDETVLDPKELGAFLKDRLPAYKIPAVFEERDSLPKSEAGKVMKTELS